jgi:hypothetical protein
MEKSNSMYKVCYQPSSSGSESSMLFKWFNTMEEATEFAGKLGDKILEIKQYDKPEHYPNADLDFS